MRYEIAVVRWLDASEDAECPSPTKVRGPVERTDVGWLTKNTSSVLHLLTERLDWTGGKTEYVVSVIPQILVLGLFLTGVKTDPTVRTARSTERSADAGPSARRRSARAAGGSTTSRSKVKRSSVGRGAK